MKVVKEFWVSNAFLNDDKTLPFFTFSRSKTGNFPNKITISYDIDREVTIMESDLENAFRDIYIAGHSIIDLGVMNKVKQKLFGGGDND